MKNLMKFKKWFVENWHLATWVSLLVVFGIFGIIKTIEMSIRDSYHHYTSFEIYQETNKLIYDSIKLSLVDKVDNYITDVAKTSALNGLVIVNNCLEYDIDICFVLAQGEQESHFGTKGIARKTNSVFNVFAFDGHDYNRINKDGKYSHPNDYVEPYLKLLKRDYLVDGKTEYDMFKKYVNKTGKRYASDPEYEKTLFNKFNKIRNNTDIDITYQELKKQALIIGMD